MKITHVITTIELGGAEKQLLVLAREQVRLGHEVRVIYLKGTPALGDQFKGAGVEIVFYVSNRPLVSQMFILFRLLRKNCDLIHAHLPAAEILSALVKPQIPLVVSRHNTQRFLDKKKQISKMLAVFVEWRSSKCIAISDSVRTFLIQTSEWRRREDLNTVHYGIPQNILRYNVLPKRKEPYRYLTVSRLTPQKDLDTLLQAFAIHHKKYPLDTLTIVGEGYEFKRLMRLGELLDLNECIFWLGKVKDVDSLYLTHHTFVLSSKYEGFGLVLLEAMRFGLPIIAARNTAIPEVLGDTHPGLFATGNIRELAKNLRSARDEKFAKELRQLSQARLSLFTPEIMVEKVLSIYAELI